MRTLFRFQASLEPTLDRTFACVPKRGIPKIMYQAAGGCYRFNVMHMGWLDLLCIFQDPISRFTP
jgi:hypothetical protein